MKRLLVIVALTSAFAQSQTVQPLLQPRQTFVNSAGSPCTGCKLYSYSAGTTTPLATYVDSTGVTANTNPIVLDVAGGANIWIKSFSYKFTLKGTDGSTIWTVDNVNPTGGSPSDFLPLTGGMLTGPLNGTSASFSGTVAAASANVSGTGTFGTVAVGKSILDANGLNAIASDITPWDSGFETFPENLVPWGFVANGNTVFGQSQTYQKGGASSMSVQRTDLTGSGGVFFKIGPSGIFSYSPVPIIAGHTYTLNGYYRTAGGTSSFTVMENFNAATATDTSGASAAVTLPASGAWTYFSVQLTATTSAGAGNYVWLAGNLASTSEIVYFDDVFLFEGTATPTSKPSNIYSGFTPRNFSTLGQIVFAGDSLTVGYGSVTGGWVPKLSTPAGYAITNVALGGNNSWNLRGMGTTLVDPLFTPNADDITVIWAGANDMWAPAPTFSAAATEANIATYARERKRLGWRVMVVTMPSMLCCDVNRNALNTLLRANWWRYADALVDLAAAPHIGADGSGSDTTYYLVDGIHMTDAGYDVVQDQMQDALDKLILRTPYAFAGTGLVVGTWAGDKYHVNGTGTPAKNMRLSYNAGAGRGEIQAADWSGSLSPIVLNPMGGLIEVGPAGLAVLGSTYATYKPVYSGVTAVTLPVPFPANSCVVKQIAVMGATTAMHGASCAPNGWPGADGLLWSPYLNSTNYVGVNICNPTTAPITASPATIDWSCTVTE